MITTKMSTVHTSPTDINHHRKGFFFFSFFLFIHIYETTNREFLIAYCVLPIFHAIFMFHGLEEKEFCSQAIPEPHQ